MPRACLIGFVWEMDAPGDGLLDELNLEITTLMDEDNFEGSLTYDECKIALGRQCGRVA